MAAVAQQQVKHAAVRINRQVVAGIAGQPEGAQAHPLGHLAFHLHRRLGKTQQAQKLPVAAISKQIAGAVDSDAAQGVHAQQPPGQQGPGKTAQVLRGGNQNHRLSRWYARGLQGHLLAASEDALNNPTTATFSLAAA